MSSILLVDDHQQLLNSLNRTFYLLPDEWEVDVANNGKEAIEMLNNRTYDVIVTDIKMPIMNGADLLDLVVDKYHSTIRIVLSGYTEKDLIYKTVGTAHHFLTKPVDLEKLITVIRRALCLRAQLTDVRIRSLVSGVRTLPSLPKVYQELIQALQKTNVSMGDIESIVSRDVGLTAKLLHLVNSSFFGRINRVASVMQAIQLLGVEVVKAIAVSTAVFAPFKENKSNYFSMRSFEEGSMAVAIRARELAKVEDQELYIVEDSFIAGMMLEIGRLIVAANLPEEYDQIHELVLSGSRSIAEAEQEKLGVSYAEIGAFLLSLWGFRDNVVEAVAFQDTPLKGGGDGFSPLTAVHVAKGLTRAEIAPGAGFSDTDDVLGLVDVNYLRKLGHLSKLEKWQLICNQHTHN